MLRYIIICGLTRSLVLWIPSRNIGYEIGYPCLTLHAIQSTRHSLYLQIEIDTELLEITIVPQNQSEVQGIYDALSQCSSLHPDIDSDPEDQYGGEPLEGDWITEDLENGDADDVVTTETNGFSHNKNPDTAGLAIEIEGNSQPGTRRTRDDTENAEEENEEDNIKWRKTN